MYIFNSFFCKICLNMHICNVIVKEKTQWFFSQNSEFHARFGQSSARNLCISIVVRNVHSFFSSIDDDEQTIIIVVVIVILIILLIIIITIIVIIRKRRTPPPVEVSVEAMGPSGSRAEKIDDLHKFWAIEWISIIGERIFS